MYSKIIIINIINIFITLCFANNDKHVSSVCGNKICLQKCCPVGQYVLKAKGVLFCSNYTEPQDFSSIIVYDKNIEKTNKKFYDLFGFEAGIFIRNTEFIETVLNVEILEIIPRLTETGLLYLEHPNEFHRWTEVPKENFCIDYRLARDRKTKNYLSKGIKFWSIIPLEENAESSIYLTISIFVSCVFMLLVLIVYILLPELRNLCGRILMAYVASLFMAFLLLAIIQIKQHTINACIGLSMGVYFFFLATFCWMNVMSYDIWWTFRGYAKARPIHRRGECFKFCMYCLYAFGLPLAMTIVLFVLNTIDMSHMPWFVTPKVPKLGCFLEGAVKMLYLYTPMLIMIIFNWIFFLMTTFNIWRLSRGTAVLDSAAAGTPAAHRTHFHRFMVYLKLSVVMGLNWLLEIVSFLYPGLSVWKISDAYNILIGFLIFLIFVCKKKTYTKLKKRYGGRSPRWNKSSKSYSSSASDSQETTTFQICPDPKGSDGINTYVISSE